MTSLSFLIPIALFMGLSGLAAFFWAMRSGQFDDLEGPGYRVLMDDDKASGESTDEGSAAGRSDD